MSRVRTVDFRAVREARERLDKLARAHPQLTGRPSKQNRSGWERVLTAEEENVMPNERTVQCAFRLPESLVERVDAFAEHMAEAQPGVTFTRADAVRALLTRALDEAAPKKHPRTKARQGARK